MTLKPPYRGRTLKDVPPTETFTKPRVVMVLPRTCVERRTDLCRARAAVCCLVLRRAGQPRRPAGAALKNSQLNPWGTGRLPRPPYQRSGRELSRRLRRFLSTA